MTRFYPIETSNLYSPAWFVPYDEFHGRVHAVGVLPELARFDFQDGVWLPDDTPPIRTPSAAIAYPQLGRRTRSTEPRRYRVRFTASGYEPLYPADGEPFSAGVDGIEFFAYPYDDTSPPAVAAEPRLVRLLPGIAFPYGPGVRTVYGAVVDGTTQAPVANALVAARGTTSQDGVAWLERTLSDPRGNFRLSLRWEGELATGGQRFTVTATEGPDRAGSLEVLLPRDRDRRQVIEIVQQ